MNIVIVGDGKVGYTLAECLSQEQGQHNVTMVDKNLQALNRAGDTLDVMCIKGNGANVGTLIEAGVEQADILIAVTTNDETNMVCCLMGKKLGAKYVIARIRDPEYTDSLQMLEKQLGIDMIINPERAAAREISRLFRDPFAINVETFGHKKVEMVEFRLEAQDELAGIPIKHLAKKFSKVLYCAVERDGEGIIPDGEFSLKVGDKVCVVGELFNIAHFFKRIGRNTQRVRSAILVGGGHISYYLAKILEETNESVALKLIEIRKDKCERLSEQLKHVDVVHGDGTDRELLEGENLRSTDALVCLTDRDEENLITGLYGKKSRVPKVIVKVNRLNYLDVVEDMGLGSVISPKYATANVILRQVRALSMSQDKVAEKLYRLMGGHVEAQEFLVPAGSGAGYLNVPLSTLRIKKGVLVGVIVRNRRVIIPFGTDHIEAGDNVILISKAGQIFTIEDALGHR